MAKTKSVELREVTLQSHLKEANIDEANCVIRDVKLLGRHSKNGREYTDKALDSAARLMEGAAAGIFHKRDGSDHGFTETNGEYQGIKRKEDGVYGDHHYEAANPNTPLMLERAKRFPTKFGYSHHATGPTSRNGRKVLVEDIDRVYSVDFVRNPATTGGMWESVESTVKLSEYPESPLLTLLLEMDGMAEMEVAALASEADPVREAFKAAITAVMDSDCDIKSLHGKITAILGAYAKVSEGMPGPEDKSKEGEQPPGSSPDGNPPEDAPPPGAPQTPEDKSIPGDDEKEKKTMAEAKTVEALTKENSELKEKVAGFEKAATAREVLEAVELGGNDELYETLLALPSKEVMEKVASQFRKNVDDLKESVGKPQVRSARSQADNKTPGAYPANNEEFVKNFKYAR